MRILLFAGLLLVVLGIASLVVPIPHSETHGIKAGDIDIGVQTSHSERVSPIISGSAHWRDRTDYRRGAFPAVERLSSL